MPLFYNMYSVAQYIFCDTYILKTVESTGVILLNEKLYTHRPSGIYHKSSELQRRTASMSARQ